VSVDGNVELRQVGHCRDQSGRGVDSSGRVRGQNVFVRLVEGNFRKGFKMRADLETAREIQMSLVTAEASRRGPVSIPWGSASPLHLGGRKRFKTQEDTRLRVVRVTTEDGQRIVGIQIPRNRVGAVLRESRTKSFERS
jgi:hypothetical protein